MNYSMRFLGYASDGRIKLRGTGFSPFGVDSTKLDDGVWMLHRLWATRQLRKLREDPGAAIAQHESIYP